MPQKRTFDESDFAETPKRTFEESDFVKPPSSDGAFGPMGSLIMGVDPHTLLERLGGAASTITNFLFPAGDTPRHVQMPELTPQEEIGAKTAALGGAADITQSLAKALISPTALTKGAYKLRSAASDVSPSGIPTSKHGLITQAAKALVKPAANATATGMEKFANILDSSVRPISIGSEMLGPEEPIRAVMGTRVLGPELPEPPSYGPLQGPPQLSPADINKWMNVTSPQMMHGANPGKQILAEGLLGPDKQATATKAQAALADAGQTLEKALQAATERGITLDAQTPVYDALNAASKRIGAPKDAAFTSQINGILDDIESQFPNLAKLPPDQAQKLKVQLGKAIQWSGSGYDAPANKAMVQIYGDINQAIKDAIPGIAPLQDRWGSLYHAVRALKGSLIKDALGRGTGLNPIGTVGPQ